MLDGIGVRGRFLIELVERSQALCGFRAVNEIYIPLVKIGILVLDAEIRGGTVERIIDLDLDHLRSEYLFERRFHLPEYDFHAINKDHLDISLVGRPVVLQPENLPPTTVGGLLYKHGQSVGRETLIERHHVGVIRHGGGVSLDCCVGRKGRAVMSSGVRLGYDQEILEIEEREVMIDGKGGTVASLLQ